MKLSIDDIENYINKKYRREFRFIHNNFYCGDDRYCYYLVSPNMQNVSMWFFRYDTNINDSNEIDLFELKRILTIKDILA